MKQNYKRISMAAGILAVVMSLLITYAQIFGGGSGSRHKRNVHLIGESYMTMNNEFYRILSEEISHRVEAEGDRLVLRDPALSVERQTQQIESMLRMGIDALVVAPVDWSSLNPVLQRAKENGVKIIVVDTNVKDEQLVDCTITSDNYNAGYLVGQYFREHHHRAKVLLMTHGVAKSGQDRIRGFLDAVEAEPGIQIAERIECEGQMEIAMPRLLEIIEKGVDFDNVFCLNDLASVGVAAALDENGMLDETGIYGVDGSPDAKALIKEGMMDATAAQFPSRIGAQAADVLYRLLEGEAVEKDIAVPVELITADNVDQYHVGRWQ